MKLAVRFQAILRVVAVLLCVFLAKPDLSSGALQTKNAFVWAQVEDASGLITIATSPGPAVGKFLSFPQHSYLAVQIGNSVYTNNPPANTGLPDYLSSNGVLTKVGDTIYCTWFNLRSTNVDVIQKVYPVAFSKSGQIVISVSFVNHNLTAPVACAAQFLLDLEIGGNDQAKVLTKDSYTSNWTTYVSTNPGIPQFYLSWEKPLPNPPTYSVDLPTNPCGFGFANNTQLGLQVPTRITLGDWTQLSARQWGPASGNGAIGDMAILFEWPATGVKADSSVEVMRTSYGTPEIESCVGGLLGVFLYPHTISFDTTLKSYTPNPFTVDAFIFNTDLKSSAMLDSLQLAVGPMLKIVSPLTSLSRDSSTETLTSPSLPGGGYAAMSWNVQVQPNTNCADSMSYLAFTSSSSVSPSNFANPSPCSFPIKLACSLPVPATRDTLAPFILKAKSTDTSKDGTKISLHVLDSRIADLGLDTIEVLSNTNSSFVIAPTLVPCDTHDTVAITMTQADTTKEACGTLLFRDCAGNSIQQTICIAAKMIDTTHHDTTQVVHEVLDEMVQPLRVSYSSANFTIHFTKANTTRELHLYNILGREVSVTAITPNASEVSYPTNGLSAGTYFAKLDNQSVKIMVGGEPSVGQK